MRGNKKLWVALALLPLFIFFAYISVSYAVEPNIQAVVRVVPTPQLKCLPNPLVVGSLEKYVTCFVNLENYPTNKIIPSSLQLSLADVAVTPIPIKNSFGFGDFDNNGITELKVTFDKSSFDKWFFNLDLPTNFKFKVTGQIEGVEGYTFTVYDTIQVIKPSYTFVYFNGKGGDVTTIKGIDLTKATITSSNIEKSGHQLIKFDSLNFIKRWDDILGTVTGEVPVQITKTKSIKLGFTAWVRYTGDGCTFNPYTSMVCDGKGMFYKRGLAVGYSSESVDVHFEVNGDKASLVAKQGSKIVFEQSNVPVGNFQYVIKTKSSFLFF